MSRVRLRRFLMLLPGILLATCNLPKPPIPHF